jgi:hypothetical protein
MTPRARGHPGHRALSRTLFRRPSGQKAKKDRTRGVGSGRSVADVTTSPVTTPHPHPTSIDHRADAIAPPPVRRPRRRFVFSKKAVGRVSLCRLSVDRWNRRVANLHGGPTRWKTRNVIGCV